MLIIDHALPKGVFILFVHENKILDMHPRSEEDSRIVPGGKFPDRLSLYLSQVSISFCNGFKVTFKLTNQFSESTTDRIEFFLLLNIFIH